MAAIFSRLMMLRNTSPKQHHLAARTLMHRNGPLFQDYNSVLPSSTPGHLGIIQANVQCQSMAIVNGGQVIGPRPEPRHLHRIDPEPEWPPQMHDIRRERLHLNFTCQRTHWQRPIPGATQGWTLSQGRSCALCKRRLMTSSLCSLTSRPAILTGLASAPESKLPHGPAGNMNAVLWGD